MLLKIRILAGTRLLLSSGPWAFPVAVPLEGFQIGDKGVGASNGGYLDDSRIPERMGADLTGFSIVQRFGAASQILAHSSAWQSLISQVTVSLVSPGVFLLFVGVGRNFEHVESALSNPDNHSS